MNENISWHDIKRKFIFSYLVPLLLIILWLGFITLLSQCSEKEKKYDKELWQPWLEIRNEKIQFIELHPILTTGYYTISNVVRIEDKKLISEIKDNLNRRLMTNEDKIGYHWFSSKRLRITAYTEKKEFSFILFFHGEFPSVQYQMLVPTKEKHSAFRPQECLGFYARGEGWRSAKLYNVINEFISHSKKVHWNEYAI